MEAAAAVGEFSMSVAQEIPDATAKAPKVSPTRHNGRWSGYWHLLKARLLELKREPEVVFWVYDGPSANVVQLNERGGIPFKRIVEAIKTCDQEYRTSGSSPQYMASELTALLER